MRAERHLLALLTLLVATGFAVTFARPTDAELPLDSVAIAALPLEAAGWRGAPGAPQDVLPIDPRAAAMQRWTYVRGGKTVWLSVGRYRAGNDPRQRPLLDRIVGASGSNVIKHDEAPLVLNAVSDRLGASVPMNRVALRRGNQSLAIDYWYELSDRTITGEYTLRFWLFLDTLQGRRRPLTLVRVAADGQPTLDAFLQVFYVHLAQSIGRERG
jgi:EpsI family protein